jgi:hypothetical protein
MPLTSTGTGVAVGVLLGIGVGEAVAVAEGVEVIVGVGLGVCVGRNVGVGGRSAVAVAAGRSTLVTVGEPSGAGQAASGSLSLSAIAFGPFVCASGVEALSYGTTTRGVSVFSEDSKPAPEHPPRKIRSKLEINTSRSDRLNLAKKSPRHFAMRLKSLVDPLRRAIAHHDDQEHDDQT